MLTVLVILGALNLLTLAGIALWLRARLRTAIAAVAQHHHEMRGEVGAAVVTLGTATAEFSRQAVALLGEVREASGAAPVPPPAASTRRLAERPDDGDERATVEMVPFRESADEVTRVVDPMASPISGATKAKLARFHAPKGGAS